jgi:TRAP-type mannitol/chloroaromatic compound transport system permease small subunit
VASLAAFIRAVDRMNDAVGRWASWFLLGSVVVCAATTTLRYAFNVGFVWTQELYVALFGLNFMLAAGYAYCHDQHVRVDIYYDRRSPRGRAWVDASGVLIFLLPWLGVVGWAAYPFARLSWSVLEPSSQSGGLPGLFVLKSAIFLFVILLGIQGFAVLARSALVLVERADLLPPRPGF